MTETKGFWRPGPPIPNKRRLLTNGRDPGETLYLATFGHAPELGMDAMANLDHVCDLHNNLRGINPAAVPDMVEALSTSIKAISYCMDQCPDCAGTGEEINSGTFDHPPDVCEVCSNLANFKGSIAAALAKAKEGQD